MPLYEYRCENCGEQFEVMQKFSDEPLLKHEKCGGRVTRLLSAPAFQFKGSGWYITDYAKSSSGQPNSAKSDSGNGDSGSAKKSDSSSTASKTPATSGSSSGSSDTK